MKFAINDAVIVRYTGIRDYEYARVVAVDTTGVAYARTSSYGRLRSSEDCCTFRRIGTYRPSLFGWKLVHFLEK